MTGYLKSKMVFRDFYGNEMLLNHLWLLLRSYYHAVRHFTIDFTFLDRYDGRCLESASIEIRILIIRD